MPGVELTRYFHKNANCLAIPFDDDHKEDCLTILTNEMAAGKLQIFQLDYLIGSDSYQVAYRYKDAAVGRILGPGYYLALFNDGKYEAMPAAAFEEDYSTTPPENYAAVVGTAVVGG